MKTITLPTSPEIRAAFTELGLALSLERAGTEERWSMAHETAFRLQAGQEPLFYSCPPVVSAQVLLILRLLEPPKGMVMISIEDARECAEQVVFRVSDWRMAAWKWKKIERFDLEDDCTRRADRLAEIRDRLHGALHPETPQETVAILKE